MKLRYKKNIIILLLFILGIHLIIQLSISKEGMEVVEKGCYRDRGNRAIRYRNPNVGINRNPNDSNNINKSKERCMNYANNRGHKYFGLQCFRCGVECWSSNDWKRAKKYGNTGCSKVGDNWKNYVYEIKKESEKDKKERRNAIAETKVTTTM
jgi:hypothetical protein